MEPWRPKLFLTDWDGTLFDSRDLHIKASEEVFRYFHIEIPPKNVIRNNVGMKLMDFFWEHGVPKEFNHDDLRKEIWDPYIDRNWERAILYPSARRLLVKLKYYQIPVIVMSGTAFEPLMKRIAELDLWGLIRSACPDAFDRKKAIEGALLTDAGIIQQETVYMDDIASGILAGKEAGVRTIGITHGMQDRELIASANPDILVDDLDEVIERLEKGDFS